MPGTFSLRKPCHISKKCISPILPLDTARVMCVRHPLAHASFDQFGFTYLQWHTQAYMVPNMAATHSMRGFPFSPIDSTKRTTLYMTSSKDSNCLPISGIQIIFISWYIYWNAIEFFVDIIIFHALFSVINLSQSGTSPLSYAWSTDKESISISIGSSIGGGTV